MQPLILGDARLLEQGTVDLVEAAQQELAAIGVEVEPLRKPAVVRHRQRREIDDDFVAVPPPDRRALRSLHERVDLGRAQLDRHDAIAATVGEKDVREGRRDDRAEAVFRECPDGMFTRRAATEVRSGDQDRRALGRGIIELEPRLRAPVEKQAGAKTGALEAPQKLLRDDLIGVHVLAWQRGRFSPVTHERLHHATSARRHARTSTSWPAIAAAAAIVGLMRCVRPPRPWRPSKLRLEVAAQRSPTPSTSAFIPRHIEQPAFRHSKPASRNTRSNPSRSASRLTRFNPGTTIARTRGATCKPRTMLAAARRSSMRALVHDPTNTRSIGIPSSGVPGVSPMYSSARAAARRS